MTSRLIWLLLASCLLFLGCATRQQIVTPTPVMEGTNWIIATGPLTGASVTCKDGYVPTCSYVQGAVKCSCAPTPKK